MQLSERFPEAQFEFNALKTFVSYYHITNGSNPNFPMTVFGHWRAAAWSSNPIDINYYRTQCNIVVAAALVKRDEPSNPNVDWDRVKAILVYVMREYFYSPSSPATYGTGWGSQFNWTTGFVGYPGALAAALTWDQFEASETFTVNGVVVNGKATIRDALRHLANQVLASRTVSYYESDAVVGHPERPRSCGNTATEEASGDAAFLAAMSQFDRNYPNSQQWLTRAQDLFEWVYNHMNKLPNCPAPINSVNNHPYNYDGTSTNHSMYPHPHYALSVINDAAGAMLPWVAQGLFIQTNPSGITGITSLSFTSSSGNHKFYGGWDGNLKVYIIYNSNTPFIKVSSDFTYQGVTYNAASLDQGISFASKQYLGVSGVSDWGIGAGFHNGAWALPAWIDLTFYPAPGVGEYNYARLLLKQSQSNGYGYLPTFNTSGCASTSRPMIFSGWGWGYLSAACGGSMHVTTDTCSALVPFFECSPTYSRNGQINIHLFLNSYGALSHAVAYLFMRTPLWPKTTSGKSSLPNFRF